MEITLTNENFEEEVLNSDVPVLVDFWAVWCMPCKMLAPIVEELANEAEQTVSIVDEVTEIMQNQQEKRCWSDDGLNDG